MRTGVQCGAATRGRLLQADSTGSCRIFRRTVVERPDSMRTPHIKKQDPLKGPVRIVSLNSFPLSVSEDIRKVPNL